jgi:hypothetical protein
VDITLFGFVRELSGFGIIGREEELLFGFVRELSGFGIIGRGGEL